MHIPTRMQHIHRSMTGMEVRRSLYNLAASADPRPSLKQLKFVDLAVILLLLITHAIYALSFAKIATGNQDDLRLGFLISDTQALAIVYLYIEVYVESNRVLNNILHPGCFITTLAGKPISKLGTGAKLISKKHQYLKSFSLSRIIEEMLNVGHILSQVYLAITLILCRNYPYIPFYCKDLIKFMATAIIIKSINKIYLKKCVNNQVAKIS
ncbi:MAG: hypothetical protein MHMPM18_000780 [Marteilia pararefringens]